MAKDIGGPKIDQGDTPEPPRENRDRDQTGITGTRLEGETPSPGDRDETCAEDGPAAIDLDAAHDRAS